MQFPRYIPGEKVREKNRGNRLIHAHFVASDDLYFFSSLSLNIFGQDESHIPGVFLVTFNFFVWFNLEEMKRRLLLLLLQISISRLSIIATANQYTPRLSSSNVGISNSPQNICT